MNDPHCSLSMQWRAQRTCWFWSWTSETPRRAASAGVTVSVGTCWVMRAAVPSCFCLCIHSASHPQRNNEARLHAFIALSVWSLKHLSTGLIEAGAEESPWSAERTDPDPWGSEQTWAAETRRDVWSIISDQLPITDHFTDHQCFNVCVFFSPREKTSGTLFTVTYQLSTSLINLLIVVQLIIEWARFPGSRGDVCRSSKQHHQQHPLLYSFIPLTVTSPYISY